MNSLSNSCDMKNDLGQVWFWQKIVTPHMYPLASALVNEGFEVVYVAQQMMSDSRRSLGWESSVPEGVRLIISSTESDVRDLVSSLSQSSHHICQGVRGNDLIGIAQNALHARGIKYYVVMETVNDSGFLKGFLKKVVYRILFLIKQNWFLGVLAIGYRTPKWISRRGVNKNKIYPFTYFLPRPVELTSNCVRLSSEPYNFIYVGGFVEGKRLGLLISKLSTISSIDFRLTVVGMGPLEKSLQKMSMDLLGDRVRWIGQLPINKVSSEISKADCLVLPSSHDGWGAVVSEALLVGTPVICSDACGSAGVVRKSGVGGVFAVNDVKEFGDLLSEALENGRISTSKRREIASWALFLSSERGATYLANILLKRDVKNTDVFLGLKE